MHIKLPPGAEKIITTLKNNGYEAFVVGGCVRDSLLGLEPHDWDICTSAMPDEMERCFDGYHIIETGLKHGTLTVVLDDGRYEVTTYRIDGEYSDNRHPDEVRFVVDIKSDLSRRDFTINAMAYGSDGLIDCFGGEQDLQHKLIRCVGSPDDRFKEDALRIMRALRFASTYGFSIAEQSGNSICGLKHLLKNIAVERISVEFYKLLCGAGAEQILLNYTDVLGVFIPELLPMVGFQQNNPHHVFDVWQHTVKSIVSAPPDIVIRLTMLFHDIGKPGCYTADEAGVGHFYGHGQRSADMGYEIMKRLKFDNNTISEVKELVLYHDAELQPRRKHIRRWLNKIGENRLRQLVQVKRADVLAQSDLDRRQRLDELDQVVKCINETIDQQQCFSLKDLAVDGRDLIEAGIPEGVQIGSMLNKLMNMVIEEQVENNKTDLLSIVKML